MAAAAAHPALDSTPASALEAALRHDRRIVGGALALLSVLAWLATWRLAASMNMAGDMADMPMSAAEMAAMLPALQPWRIADAALMLAMWVVMMTGMMTPSAAPMILLYARVARQAAGQGRPFAASGWFAGGYLCAWFAFSVVATLAQWLLERATLLTPMLGSASHGFGAAVLLAVGVYQWTPLKQACLVQCRAPLTFIQRHGGFRPGATGSLRLGAWHGAYCVGCCWALMALLFVGGVMNLLWIAAISIMVLLEKLLPGGRWFPRLAGLVFIALGLGLLTISPEWTR